MRRTTQLAIGALLALATAAQSAAAQTHIRAAAVASATSSSTAATAATSSSSSASAASRAAGDEVSASAVRTVASVWTPDDPCSATTQRAGCIFEPSCSLCLTRDGCAVESTTGKCVSVSRIAGSSGSAAGNTSTGSTNSASANASSAVSAPVYFESGKFAYCDATDAACAACSSSSGSGSDASSDALCTGASGCVCLRQCEAQASAAPLECVSVLSLTPKAYFIMAGVVFAAASIGYQVRRAQRQRALGSGRLVQRRRQRPAADAPHPLALKLDNWQKDRSDHADAFVDISLKSCYVQLDEGDDRVAGYGVRGDGDERRSEHDSERETELGNGSFCSDLELDGFEYVAASATEADRSGSRAA